MSVKMLNNKKLNLSLKLNGSLTNLQDTGPFTPLEQTLKTPLEAPNNYFHPGFAPPNAPYAPPHASQPQQNPAGQIYSNPHYNESDDILTDIDEPSFTSKIIKNYSLNFTPTFDHLVLSIYSHILSLPTTTPFSGQTPPSGLVSKVANETMTSLLNDTTKPNYQPYDQQHVINNDFLRNNSYQPIFLQLIRKRLLELCSDRHNTAKLPISTTVTVTNSNVNHGSSSNNNPYGANPGVRQSSISNLSLTDLNVANFQQQQQQSQQQQQNQQNQSRSRSSSMSLRKQSLTRNNSYNNNWLHVGNLSSIKPPHLNHAELNNSTESLQSMQDYVPQSFINRSAVNTPTANNSAGGNSFITPNSSVCGFNSLMMDYQTPPSSNKSSFSTPPGGANSNVQVVHNSNGVEYDEFNFTQNRSRGASRANAFPRPLTINTENANIQALNSLTGNNGETLDSPFMSATTPSEEYMYHNGFPMMSNSIPESPVEEAKEPISLPTRVSLSEKKRDSLKLKRGIH